MDGYIFIKGLESWDRQIFHWINNGDWGLFGSGLVYLTDLHKNPWFLLCLVLGLSLWSFFKKKWLPVVLLLIWIGLGDFLGGQIKDLLSRSRPDLQGLEVVWRCPHGGGGSMPSNHSLNNFALWAVTKSYLGTFHWALLLWASLIATSRVYCGVHFPSDVLVGAILGIFWGWLGSFLFQLWKKKRGA